MAAKEQSWTVSIDDCKIDVINDDVVKLLVNDRVQDVSLAITAGNVRLFGKTPNGKEIKVALGGTFKVHCYIFVDNELVLEA